MGETNKIAVYSALSHKIRLRILNLLLEKEMDFQEIKEELKINYNTLPFHLKVLKNANLVNTCEDSYNITEEGTQEFLSLQRRQT
jgi:predicted transcriptional regulator